MRAAQKPVKRFFEGKGKHTYHPALPSGLKIFWEVRDGMVDAF
jgi:hypothetical protein